MSKDRRCIVCGTEYEFCPHCGKVPSDLLWKNIFCSIECKEIVDICHRYHGNDISQADAYDALVRLGMKEKSNNGNMAETISKIMSYQKPEPKKVEEDASASKYSRPRRRRMSKQDDE